MEHMEKQAVRHPVKLGFGVMFDRKRSAPVAKPPDTLTARGF